MNKTLAAIAISLAPAIAQAGDPCPIPITIYDLGAPNWLEYDRLLADLDTDRAWLGIGLRNVDDGMHVVRVHPDGPAAAAGIFNGLIITSINGQPVATSAQQAMVFDNLAPDEVVDIRATIHGQQSQYDVTLGWADPVPFAVVEALRADDCTASGLVIPTEDDRAIMRRDLFNFDKSFRCDDAHIALQERGERHEVNEAYFVRGSRRLMMTMPYWGTTCVSVASLDGENLTDAAARDFVDTVIGDYIADRIANP